LHAGDERADIAQGLGVGVEDQEIPAIGVGDLARSEKPGAGIVAGAAIAAVVGPIHFGAPTDCHAMAPRAKAAEDGLGRVIGIDDVEMQCGRDPGPRATRGDGLAEPAEIERIAGDEIDERRRRRRARHPIERRPQGARSRNDLIPASRANAIEEGCVLEDVALALDRIKPWVVGKQRAAMLCADGRRLERGDGALPIAAACGKAARKESEDDPKRAVAGKRCCDRRDRRTMSRADAFAEHIVKKAERILALLLAQFDQTEELRRRSLPQEDECKMEPGLLDIGARGEDGNEERRRSGKVAAFVACDCWLKHDGYSGSKFTHPV
jgi:hypothetical protein